jgi:hypothetical protein
MRHEALGGIALNSWAIAKIGLIVANEAPSVHCGWRPGAWLMLLSPHSGCRTVSPIQWAIGLEEGQRAGDACPYSGPAQRVPIVGLRKGMIES